MQTRRNFLQASMAGGIGFWVAGGSRRAESQSPNEKLNIAIIGAGGQGDSNLNNVSSENIVAICDVDEERAARAFGAYPKATKYHDYRKLFDNHKTFDAVVVSTPDHHHAPASMAAIRLGKHVYCEKPLTHSVWEARALKEAAARAKVQTQMGNHGHALDSVRRSVEIIRSGALGKVTEVHSWTDRPIWPQGVNRPVETPAVPNTLDWYLWQGPAPDRPYHPAYCPFVWRGWWDYGTGALGDMACHVMDMPYWALELGAPLAVEAETELIHPESAPKASVIRFDFPARGDKPPVRYTWYDGGRKPASSLVGGAELPLNGSILVGDQGTMFVTDPYGASIRLLPEKKFQNFQGPAESIPRSPGHHREWIQACKGGPAPLSEFGYAADLTEAILLGNVALRVGKRITWDPQSLSCPNAPEAGQFLRRDYRNGWWV
jgi:predicted dehydrogenase